MLPAISASVSRLRFVLPARCKRGGRMLRFKNLTQKFLAFSALLERTGLAPFSKNLAPLFGTDKINR